MAWVLVCRQLMPYASDTGIMEATNYNYNQGLRTMLDSTVTVIFIPSLSIDVSTFMNYLR